MSRVDMDFEQALKAGGTVVLEEGRRLETLGLGASSPTSAGSSSRSKSGSTPQTPATPTVVPPTPTGESRRPRTAEKKRERSGSKAGKAGTSSVPIATTSLPASTSSGQPQFSDELDDPELHIRRRSLFRSPGTASSPDLATLVRKAKERGGIVGDPATHGNGDSSSSPRLDVSPHDPSLSPQNVHLSPLQPAAVSANGQERARTRTRSSTSSNFSLISPPSPGEEYPTVAQGSRPKMAKAEKLLGVAGAPMGNTAGGDPWNNGAEKKQTIRSKTTALWTKMTGSTRRPSSSAARTVPNTPITPTGSGGMSFFSQPDGPPAFSISPPPLPSYPKTARGPLGRDPYYGADANYLSKPLPPIYRNTSRSSSKEAVDHTGEAGETIKQLKPRPTVLSSKPNRRRSMSVDDSEIRKALALVDVGVEKAQPALPKQDHDSSQLLGGWKLASTSDLTDVKTAISGIAGPSISSSPQRARILRPRAHSDAREPYHLDVPPHSRSTPSSPPVDQPQSTFLFDTNASLAPINPDKQKKTENRRSAMSDHTAMPHHSSNRTTPEPNDRSTSQNHSPRNSSSLSLPPQASSSRGPLLRVSSDNLPSTNVNRSPWPRRGSDDTSSLQVSIDSPTAHRTIRLMTSPPPLRMSMDPSASSLDVSVYEDAISASPETPTDPAQKAQLLAERCWQEDETFLTKEKIAEWLGSPPALNKMVLTHYMNHFDFTGQRLDNAFRNLCAKLYLKGETQQVDRILDNFGRRYWECNPNSMFGSASVVHSVSYSLLLLNTDLHVADLVNHMSRPQFVRNTLFAINESLRAGSPSNNLSSTSPAGRSSTPDLTSPTDDSSSHRSGEVSDAPSTLRMRSKRSGSIHSWNSGSKEGPGGPYGNQSSPALIANQAQASAATDQPRPSLSNPPASSVVLSRTWEHDMENLLKEMYNSVKAQQILQPITSLERNSVSSLAPGNGAISRSRSQRNHGPTAALKRGSIRGIQTLLGSQSPYSSNSSSTDGRVSPSPSFATSLGEAVSASASSLFAPTLGFASNLSYSIIKEAQEDDLASVASLDTDDTSVSMTDEELALQGPPWAKEGMLCRKQYWESKDKRAKDKNWADVFVVIQKGELNMFTFGDGSGSTHGGGVGGGNWLSNATPMGTVTLAHSLAHSLPPPGYNRSRPHCFVLTLATEAVYFFQAGTEDLVNEWVSTCNYWAARVSKEPLAGGVSNMEYGWSRVSAAGGGSAGGPVAGAQGGPDLYDPSDNYSDVFSVRSGRSKLSKKSFSDMMGSSRALYSPYAMDKIFINDWKAPMPSTIHSTCDEETQLEALQKQVVILKADLTAHEKIQIPMQQMYQHRSGNFLKAVANWEAKSKHLLTEVFKYETYVECLRNAMSLRMKKRGEKVLEKALGTSQDDAFIGAPRVIKKRSLQQETIQEAEEPLTPSPGATFGHRRETAS